MMKKSKKIIASLLMGLTLVSVMPCTQTFATSKDNIQRKVITMTVDGVVYNVPKDQSLADEGIVEKDGKYYHALGDSIQKSKDFGDYYAKEDGTLAMNEWIYVHAGQKWNYAYAGYEESYFWKYYGSDMKNVKGYQTINGKKYGYMAIGWEMRVKNEHFDTTMESAKEDNSSKDKYMHYYGEDGAIKEGWVQRKNKWYYIYSDGLMATDTITPDGYHVNKDGVWVK